MGPDERDIETWELFLLDDKNDLKLKEKVSKLPLLATKSIIIKNLITKRGPSNQNLFTLEQ